MAELFNKMESGKSEERGKVFTKMLSDVSFLRDIEDEKETSPPLYEIALSEDRAEQFRKYGTLVQDYNLACREGFQYAELRVSSQNILLLLKRKDILRKGTRNLIKIVTSDFALTMQDHGLSWRRYQYLTRALYPPSAPKQDSQHP